MWLGLTVQLRCLSAALVTAWVSWQKEPKVSLAPWGDGARSHPPPRWGTEGAFRLSSCAPTPSLSQPLSWDSINPQEQRRWISALTDKGNLLEKQTPRPELHTWLTNLGSYLHSQNKWSRPEYKCSCNLLPWLNEIGSSPIQTEGFFPYGRDIWAADGAGDWGNTQWCNEILTELCSVFCQPWWGWIRCSLGIGHILPPLQNLHPTSAISPGRAGGRHVLISTCLGSNVWFGQCSL